MLFEGDEIYYLPKDRVMVNQPVPLPQDVVAPSDVVRHFIEESSHRLIMNKCICRDATPCKNFPIDLGCLFMGEASLKIHSELGRQVSKEEAQDHLTRASELGLVQMLGRNKIDTQWLGATPGDHLLTVCNCCSCCCLYRVLPDLHQSISRKITRMPGVSLSVDAEKCIGCGKCARGCFVQAITLENGRAQIGEGCVGCASCVELCPVKAISLKIEDSTFMETTIQRLTAKIDVK